MIKLDLVRKLKTLSMELATNTFQFDDLIGTIYGCVLFKYFFVVVARQNTFVDYGGSFVNNKKKCANTQSMKR